MKKKYLGIINREVVTAAPDTTAVDIANLMVENDIGVIVVMDKGVVKGIISERDITRRIVAKNVDPKNTLASDFMTKEVLSVEISDGLNVIYKTLCEMRFRHLLIMDKGKLIGITSRRDLLDGISAFQGGGTL